ncbi:MAG TPA: hypothetical protein VGK29_15545 [Paludibaculum sp.]|jgi:hypothetical protein
MKSRLFLATITVSLAAFGQWGGQQTRRAEIRGGGGDGKCTIEVEVDDTAEVEIRGDTATLRTRSGQRATWRRFQCNQVMPLNPNDFRFRGIDGRGRQELVRDPRNGGAAVIRIDDPKGGSEGYTFDVEWRGGSGGSGGGWGGNDGGGGGWGNNGGNGRGNNGGRWGNGGGNNGGGWGNGNNGGGWNGSSGSTFNFRGDGNGFLNRRNGRDQRVRDVNVTLSRDGRVSLSFEAEGYQRLNFVGRADSYNRDSIVTELRSGNTRGSATIYIDRRGEVERIEMSGRTNNDDFRLQWRAR